MASLAVLTVTACSESSSAAGQALPAPSAN
ncbi:MAG: hypothetical protein RJA55_2484, partial [Acidobacteriota bacterium]